MMINLVVALNWPSKFDKDVSVEVVHEDDGGLVLRWIKLAINELSEMKIASDIFAYAPFMKVAKYTYRRMGEWKYQE